MSRQLDISVELRESKRQTALVKALEYGLVGALEFQGIILQGFAIRYDAFSCLMTIKAEVAGTQSVAFVGSDTIINCILKAQADATRQALQWRADKYKDSGSGQPVDKTV